MAGQKVNIEPSFDTSDLLHSSVGVRFIGVTISSAAEDDGSYLDPSDGKVLRRGLVLGRIAESGLYKEFDESAEDGSEVSANVLVLAQNVDLRDGENKQAVAISAGQLKRSEVFGLDDLEEEECQRLSFYPFVAEAPVT